VTIAVEQDPEKLRTTRRATEKRRKAAIKAARAERLTQGRQVIEATLAGYTIREAAAQLGIAPTTAYDHMREAELDFLRSGAENVIRFRSKQLLRLERMYRALYPKIQAGDPPAVREGLRVMDMMNRIEGIYAAVELEVSGTVEHVFPSAAEVFAEVARLRVQQIEARNDRAIEAASEVVGVNT